MTSPRSRDRFRIGASTLTALVTAGSLTAVGWFAGAAADQQQTKQAHDDAARARADAKAAAAKAKYDAAVARQKSASYTPRVILRPRPHRTVVHTQYVRGASTPVTIGGSTVSQPGSSTPAPTYRPPTHSTPAPPPPPPPPPAPTSGS